MILVEGQEDVILYKQVASEIGIDIEGDFYGWSVGGAEKMRTIATLLNELGFERVVGLLDGNRSSLVPTLQMAFPEYHFAAIPADDIRTKRAVPERAEIRGILDESGNVRPEFEEQMRAILTELNRALLACDASSANYLPSLVEGEFSEVGLKLVSYPAGEDLARLHARSSA